MDIEGHGPVKLQLALWGTSFQSLRRSFSAVNIKLYPSLLCLPCSVHLLQGVKSKEEKKINNPQKSIDLWMLLLWSESANVVKYLGKWGVNSLFCDPLLDHWDINRWKSLWDSDPCWSLLLSMLVKPAAATAVAIATRFTARWALRRKKEDKGEESYTAQVAWLLLKKILFCHWREVLN